MSLGRGLSALIPNKNNNQNKNQSSSNEPLSNSKQSQKDFLSKKENIFYIEINRIHPNPYQPRYNFSEESLKELSESIKEYGIIQPLIVSKIERSTSHGLITEYEIISGERRWRAAKMAGLSSVPAIIKEPNNKEKLVMALIENIQREDLNSLEKAKAFKKLMEEFNFTQEHLAVHIGKSRESIANTLRLLKLPIKIQEGLAQNKITEGHARALLSITDPIKQIWLYEEILAKGLSVRSVEKLTKESNAIQNNKTSSELMFKSQDNSEIKKIRDEISQKLNTKVDVVKKGNQWKITLYFYSKDDIVNLTKKIEEKNKISHENI